MLDLTSACRRRASALPWCCFPDVGRQLQHPRPTVDPSVPFSPTYMSLYTPPTPLLSYRLSISEYHVAKKQIELAEREILELVAQEHIFKIPPYKAFPTTISYADCSCRLAPPSPQPSKAWHGYRVANAHQDKVGLSADGLASAPHAPLRSRRRCIAGGRHHH
jgi:hypothetical protein